MARITEKKRIKIHGGSYCNPFCLVWKGKLAWNTWVFEQKQQIGITTVEGNRYQYNYTNLSTQRGDSGLFSIGETETVSLEAAHLSKQEANGLATLLSSLKVYNWQDGKQFEVKVVPGSFAIRNTGNQLHRISLQVERKVLTVSR